MLRLCSVFQLLFTFSCLLCVYGAPYEPTEAESRIGAKIHDARNFGDKIAYYDEFVELKNARIAESAEGQRVARAIAAEATKRADALADRLAVEAAAVGIERGEGARKHALVVAAEKNVAILRSQLGDARKRLKVFEENKEKEFKLADLISSNTGFVGAVAGDQRAGRQFGFAVAGALEKARRELKMLEGSVGARTGMSTYRSRILAAFVCSLGVCLPLWFTTCLIGRMTRSIGYKQHLIVGYIFNATASAGVVLSYFLTGRDPLVMIVSNPASKFVLSMFFVGQWTVMVTLLLHGGLLAHKKPKLLMETLLHLATYTSMILHMRLLTYNNILLLAEKTEGVRVTWRFYIGYVMVFAVLTYKIATSSVGKLDGGLVRDVNDAITSGVTGVVDEAERLLGSSLGDQTPGQQSHASRSGLGSRDLRSSGESLNESSFFIPEASAGSSSKVC